jgi:hypothetical protein
VCFGHYVQVIEEISLNNCCCSSDQRVRVVQAHALDSTDEIKAGAGYDCHHHRTHRHADCSDWSHQCTWCNGISSTRDRRLHHFHHTSNELERDKTCSNFFARKKSYMCRDIQAYYDFYNVGRWFSDTTTSTVRLVEMDSFHFCSIRAESARRISVDLPRVMKGNYENGSIKANNNSMKVTTRHWSSVVIPLVRC